MTPVEATVKELKVLKDFFQESAPTCVHQPAGMLKYRFCTPTYAIRAGADDDAEVADRSLVGHYLQMYDWDACIFSMACHRIGVEELGADVVANFLSLQQPDGFIPRTVSPNKIWDAGDLCKPFLSQTLLAELNRAGKVNLSDPASAVTRLAAYLNYYRKKRRHDSGLFFWRNVLESGIDNNLALMAPDEAEQSDSQESKFTYPAGRLLASDLNTYLVAEFRAFAALADHFGQKVLAEEYSQLAGETHEQIEKLLWNDQVGMYCNYDPDTARHVVLRSWTGLMPTLYGLSSQERTKKVIDSNILDEAHFLRPCGIASMAVSEPLHNNSKRGLYGRSIVCNWQGPVWVLTNAWVARCLVADNRKAQAAMVAERVVRTLINDIKTGCELHESYNCETGSPIWAPQFMSWNILALELIDLLE